MKLVLAPETSTANTFSPALFFSDYLSTSTLNSALAPQDATFGLMGIRNGDTSDDLTNSSGAVISSTADTETIHNMFGLSCTSCHLIKELCSRVVF